MTAAGRSSLPAPSAAPLDRCDRRAALGSTLAALSLAALAGGPLQHLVAAPPESPPPAKPAGPAEPDLLPSWEGRALKHWKIVDQFVFKRHGAVRIENGAISLGKGDPGTAVVWNGPAPPVNGYEIRFEGRRTAGDDFFCGLTFPIDKSHCTLIVGGWGGSVTGLSNVDDYPAVENETTNAVEIVENRWHKLRLRVASTAVQAWFDDTKIVDLDPREKRFGVWWEQEPVRPLGFATWNTAAEYRGLRLERLK